MSSSNYVGSFGNSSQQYESVGPDGSGITKGPDSTIRPGCNPTTFTGRFVNVPLRQEYAFLPISPAQVQEMTQSVQKSQSQTQSFVDSFKLESVPAEPVHTSVPESRRTRLEAAESDDAIVRNLLTNTIYQHPLLVAHSQLKQ